MLKGTKEFEFKAIKVDEQDYIVTYNNFSARGRTLADALHQLALQLDGAKVHGSEFYDPEVIKGERLRGCEYCGAAMFFAKTPNDRWMPVDGSTIEAKGLVVKNARDRVRAYVIIDIGGVPHVQSVSRPFGQVWIPHPEVCGLSDQPPGGKAAELRWKSNRKRFYERNRQLHGELQEFISEKHDDTLP